MISRICKTLQTMYWGPAIRISIHEMTRPEVVAIIILDCNKSIRLRPIIFGFRIIRSDIFSSLRPVRIKWHVNEVLEEFLRIKCSLGL